MQERLHVNVMSIRALELDINVVLLIFKFKFSQVNLVKSSQFSQVGQKDKETDKERIISRLN